MISLQLILKIAIIIVLIGVLTFISRSSSVKGWFGELMVDLLARFFLDKKTYHLIKNVTLPTEDSTTQIDHIIVSKYGLFVVETKNMKGWIFGSENNPEWTQQTNKQTNKFQNPLRQNYRHMKVLEEILGLMPNKIFSVIVFVGDSTFKTVLPENVTNAGGYIKYIKSKTEPLLGEFEVVDIINKIKEYRLDPGSKTHRRHVENLKNHHSRKINRKLRRAKRKKLSPLYKFAVIAAALMVFGGVAKKSILNKQEVGDQQVAKDLITAQTAQVEQSAAQKELNKVYQYKDAQGKIKYTNVATAPNAKPMDENRRIASKPVPIEIDSNKVLIPVTIRNRGMEMKTTLIYSETIPITILPMTTANFFEAENLGTAKVKIAKGKTVEGEKRRVSYFGVGDTVEPDLIFLATDNTSFAKMGILGRDFVSRHPFSIDLDTKMLVWQ
ncbi:MAG: NERD domain-containing protein [Desulfofustis sp.]|nr:NERD domain-containing protein [Desulfofustis sp.]